MYTSTKKVETITPSIETTPPVESPLPLETTPPPDDESTTDEKSENIYHDKYFTVTVYLNAVSIYLFTIACTFFAYDAEDAETVGSVFSILCTCLLIVASIMSFISLCVDSLHTKQLVLMILSVVPFPLYIITFVTFIKEALHS